jgi:tripartite-type tricarboxylate transporter receptor subunit TctC
MTYRLKTSRLKFAAAAAFVAAATLPAAAFPERLITFIVPYAAGGATDVVGRIYAEHMARTLGQQIVIENVGGGGGTVGTARGAKAAGDGHTIIVGTLGTHAAASGMFANLAYDPRKDFEPVINMATTPMIVVAKKSLPVADFNEFIAYLKTNGATLNYGSGGAGAQSHLTCAYLNDLIGAKSQHIPFRGSAPALNALIAGQVDYACNNTTEIVPQIQAATVKPLAVAGGQRVPVLPTLATANEQGLKFEATGWIAMFAPKGTPAAVVAKLNAAARSALKDEAVRKRLLDLGNELPVDADQSPEALGRFVSSEIDKWTPVIKAAGITGQ